MPVCYNCEDDCQVSKVKGQYVCEDCLLDYLYSLGFGDPTGTIPGKANTRFSERLVGLELETGAGATYMPFVRAYLKSCKGWAYKEDCSLDTGGMELVSPPVGGASISREIKRVYRVLGKHQVDMTSEAAGSHIHVDMRDVFQKLQANPTAVSCFNQWGVQLVETVRRMVDSDRAENDYCGGSFGLRNSFERKAFLPTVEPGSYPAVALRFNTLEFRIWSISDSAELTIARAEFSQKVVDYLDKAASGGTRTSFTMWSEAVKQLKLHCSFTPLAKLLGLSMPTIKALKGFTEARSQAIIEEALEY